MNDIEKLEKLYSLRRKAIEGGHVTLVTILFGAILYELHHTETPFEIKIISSDVAGDSLLTDNNDVIHIKWENHAVWERLSYLSNHVIISLMKRPVEIVHDFIPTTYNYGQQNSDYRQETEIYRQLEKLTDVVSCIQILKGNSNVFEEVRRMVKGFRLRDRLKKDA